MLLLLLLLLMMMMMVMIYTGTVQYGAVSHIVIMMMTMTR